MWDDGHNYWIFNGLDDVLDDEQSERESKDEYSRERERGREFHERWYREHLPHPPRQPGFGL